MSVAGHVLSEEILAARGSMLCPVPLPVPSLSFLLCSFASPCLVLWLHCLCPLFPWSSLPPVWAPQPQDVASQLTAGSRHRAADARRPRWGWRPSPPKPRSCELHLPGVWNAFSALSPAGSFMVQTPPPWHSLWLFYMYLGFRHTPLSNPCNCKLCKARPYPLPPPSPTRRRSQQCSVSVLDWYS